MVWPVCPPGGALLKALGASVYHAACARARRRQKTSPLDTSSSPSATDRPRSHTTIYHVYWSALRPLHVHVARLLGSFLATQDLEHSELWLWSTRHDLTADPYFATFNGSAHVKYKRYDAAQALQSSPLMQMLPPARREQMAGLTDRRSWSDSDLFRLLVLQAHGGVYIDADSLFLRDFSPLLGMEFVYNYGVDCDSANNAVMRLHRRSATSRRLLRMVAHRVNTTATGASTGGAWGLGTIDLYLKDVHYSGRKDDLVALPACFFNPHFLVEHGRARYSLPNLPSLWNGPFGMHLHGDIWREHIHPLSDYCRVVRLLADSLRTRAKSLGLSNRQGDEWPYRVAEHMECDEAWPPQGKRASQTQPRSAKQRALTRKREDGGTRAAQVQKVVAVEEDTDTLTRLSKAPRR